MSGTVGVSDTSSTCVPGLGEENEAVVPVLILAQFSRPPFVSFGTVKLNYSKFLNVRVENPTEDAAVTVTVDKIPSSRGFSVDQPTFTIPPEDSAIIRVTWTPTEEGSVREVLGFTANGIVRHRAILLGKAAGAKPKKKSLWDTIKYKRGSSHGEKVASMPIEVANKTFRVSRQPQYKRNRGSNPLTPLNQERTSRKLVEKNPHSDYCQTPASLPTAICDYDVESLSSQNRSPVVLLVPAVKFLDATGKENISSISLQNTDRKASRAWNRTLSPICSYHSFPSPLPVVCKPAKDGNSSRCLLSVKDALAVINSDLCSVSPPNACSSLNLADSLESADLNTDDNLGTALDVSSQVDVPQPRLTFFVKSSKVPSDEQTQEGLVHSPVSDYIKMGGDELNRDYVKSKTMLFNSDTVIKSKTGASAERSPNAGRTRTFRRRLLQHAPLVPSSPESDTGLPEGVSVLPAVNSNALQESELMHQQPARAAEPPTSTLSTEQPVLTLDANSASSSHSTPLDVQVKWSRVSEFPVHRHGTKHRNNRKRKSDECLRGASEHLPKSLDVKENSETQEYKKSCLELRINSSSKQVPRKCAVASSSRKSTKVLLQKSNSKASQQKGGPSFKSFSSSKVKTATVTAVAQSRLNFIQPTQTVIPRHPLPFAAKNMYFDERWIEKQERGFTWWMNYVLTPDDFKVSTKVTKVNTLSLTVGSEKSSVPKAPTKEEMSFRTYTARRHLNGVRRAACRLFTSEQMSKAIKRLEVEVEAKRLLIRKDRHLWKDIGERQKVLNWLLSYNPLWLRVGLETIFGELISLDSNSDIVGLAVFILGRLLWNPDIAAEFRHPKVPHLYRDGHEETLSRFTLKKLLLLVCFLDKAKESRLMVHDPCLFCLNAEFKATKDLLLAFSRDFLSGEGILPRHLGFLGLAVSHVQTPLDEFDFSVRNLATDLRCGVRLVRILEVLTQDWSLSSKLWMPAISRLQKVHNVDVALRVLRKKGVVLKDEHGSVIDPRDIVDGHREKTLNLLWKIIFSFQVEVLFDLEQLKEEIDFVKKTRRTKQKACSLKVGVYDVNETSTVERPGERLTLLLDWVNAVCGFYGLKAENFTVSFSDGRILCYLIHHYHPDYLKAEDIRRDTSQTIECGSLNNTSSDGDFSRDSLELKDSVSPTVDFKRLLENERRNLQLVSLAVSDLGGVPDMIAPEDMSNTIPNEKVVTCYLSFLCTRLLDLRNETRAARVIQSAWRHYKLQKEVCRNQWRKQAAAKIQSLVRRFLQKKRLLRQNVAATSIQAAWRGHLAREELRRTREARSSAIRETATVLIQKTYRKWRTRNFLKKNGAALIVQTAFRKWHARKVIRRNSAAIKIQTQYRAQQCRNQYLTKKAKAVLIQAWFRGNRQRRVFQTLKKQRRGAVIIQCTFRAFVIRKRLGRTKRAALVIQRWYKASSLLKAEHQHYKDMKAVAIKLQAAFRGREARRGISAQRRAALVLQTAYRRFVAQRDFLRLKRFAVIIQRRYRAKREGEQLSSLYLSLRHATIKIQAIRRGKAVREGLSRLHEAATVIQARYRGHAARTKFMALKRATLVVQKWYKSFKTMKEKRIRFLQLKEAAIVLQSAYRGERARRDLAAKSKAATIIQSAARAFVHRKKLLAQRRAAVVIQQSFRVFVLGRLDRRWYLRPKWTVMRLQAVRRGCNVRRELTMRHLAATVIQAYFRKHQAQVCYVAAKRAAVIIQRHYRACRSYRRIKAAAVAIQAAFRGTKARRNLRNQHRAAMLIQARVRGHLRLTEYRRRKRAMIVLQRRFRANKLRDIVQKRYIATKETTLHIQAAYRGARVRKWICKMRVAVTIIQRKYRTYKQYKEYRALRRAATFVQRRYRAKLLLTKQRRRENEERHCAAAAIQATFRMYRVRAPFRATKLATVLIQRRYRAYQGRKYFLSFRAAVRLCQQKYRAILCSRRELTARHLAATVIQAYFRKHQAQVRYVAAKRAATTIQRHYRACKSFRRIKAAVLTIQASFRGTKARRNLRNQHRAATLIQARARGHLRLTAYRKWKRATIVLQRQFRVKKLRDIVQKQYITTKEAVLRIQAAFRGARVRKWICKMRLAVTIIQRKYRTYKQYKEYRALRRAVTFQQRRYRTKLLVTEQRRRENEQRYRAAAAIQATFRMYRVRAPFRATRLATILIQRRYWAYQERKYFLSIRAAVRLCQQKYRAILCSRRYRKAYLEKRGAAIAIQAAFRRRRRETKYQVMRSSTIIIQRHYRSYMDTKATRERYLALKRCAVRLQAAYRGRAVRQNMSKMRNAALVLQKHYRASRLCLRERARFLEMRTSALRIQMKFRAYKSRKLNAQQRAVVKIQAWFRGCWARRAYVSKQTAITTIRRCLRTRVERSRFLAVQHSVRVIQRRWKETLTARKWRAEFLRIKKAVVDVQVLWRAALVKRSIQKANDEAAKRRRFAAAAYHHLCAARIQRALRVHWALKAAKKQIALVVYIQCRFLARLQRRRYLEQRRKIIVVQRAVKVWLHRRDGAAAVIQHATKTFLLRRRKQRLQNGVIKFQALWRGHRSRKLHDAAEVVSVRQRLRKINKEAKEEDTLCHKMTTALSYLLGYQNYAHILTALQHLETATRLSPESCERLVNSGATCTLFTLIRSCNRSVPSMEIITLAVQVLLNLSKYDKTVDAVYDAEESTETLLDLLQTYRDKAGDKVAHKGANIFTKVCFLLVILVQDEERASMLKKFPRASERICRISKLMLQKCQLDAQRSKAKERMNVSMNGRFLAHATPQKSKPVLRFVPDWVLAQKKMKNIVDPLGAIQALVKSLALVP